MTRRIDSFSLFLQKFCSETLSPYLLILFLSDSAAPAPRETSPTGVLLMF
jgi:hypothetical protein